MRPIAPTAQLVVGGDHHQPCVGGLELWVGIREVAQEPMLLRVVPAPREMKDHQIGVLRL
jgi:hypothetical protein